MAVPESSNKSRTPAGVGPSSIGPSSIGSLVTRFRWIVMLATVYVIWKARNAIRLEFGL